MSSDSGSARVKASNVRYFSEFFFYKAVTTAELGLCRPRLVSVGDLRYGSPQGGTLLTVLQAPNDE